MIARKIYTRYDHTIYAPVYLSLLILSRCSILLFITSVVGPANEFLRYIQILFKRNKPEWVFFCLFRPI